MFLRRFTTFPSTVCWKRLMLQKQPKFIFCGRLSQLKMSLASLSAPDTITNMETLVHQEKVLVRYVENDQSMNISFSFKGKEFNLCRNPSETLEISLGRLQMNLKKLTDKEARKRAKKMKKSDGDAANADFTEIKPSECFVLQNNEKLSMETLNKDAWVEKSLLQIDDQLYDIVLNSPSITKLRLPHNSIFAKYPLLPIVELEFASVEFTKFEWMKFIDPSIEEKKLGEKSRWEPFGEGDVAVPGTDVLGHKIKVVCLPSDGSRVGKPLEVESKVPVSSGPEDIPFETRHKLTQGKTEGDVFRVITYNILADVYADSDFSRDYLFPQCPAYALHYDYRTQLLVKEILGYNGDIVCLQEVDKKFFKTMLNPLLRRMGYEGHMCSKADTRGEEISEGEAIFYRKERYRLIEEHNINLSKTFLENEICKDLLEGVSQSGKMVQSIKDKKTVAQVLVMEDTFNSDRPVCVVNTHLFFHPRAWHIRLLQTAVILRHVECLKKQYSSQMQKELSVVICGDFNSIPLTGVHQYVVDGALPATALDWYSEGKEEHCGGINLSHSLNLASACPNIKYTNYVTSFVAAIDYIFYGRGSFTVDRVIPMPSHEDVSRFSCLPNKVFPSDHLPVICELKWLRDEEMS